MYFEFFITQCSWEAARNNAEKNGENHEKETDIIGNTDSNNESESAIDNK
jgi:hypothetical protein